MKDRKVALVGQQGWPYPAAVLYGEISFAARQLVLGKTVRQALDQIGAKPKLCPAPQIAGECALTYGKLKIYISPHHTAHMTYRGLWWVLTGL